ncbi:hypothetical protein SLS56_001691 [Neofusicoccum ribis]|uniref:Oxidoreductase acuF-like C2H2 type zinc-finger domain-containing protein n=1 Tax=Neofusicoccum ribis TaxID=45134 RepID=A0ABR3T7V7_9PEZI
MTDAVSPEETGPFGTSIAASVKRCLRSFDDLRQELHRATNKFSSEISISDVDDETGRFRVWAGNIGAHQMGLRLLDYRLRDASHIKSRVQSLLQDLYHILRDVSGEKTPWDKVLLGSDSASSDSESNSEDSDDDTELRQLAVSIRKRVTLLLRVSMSIRNPAAHDQLRRPVNIDTSYYEQFDIGHVQSKFPNAPKALVVSLGKAISRRRQYFKYRESHAKKLSFGITLQDGDARTEPQPQSTVASSLPQNVKEDTVLDIEAEEKQSESGFTQTSFATSANEMSNQGLKIPPLPKQAEGGGPFECPFCFMIISISTRRTWK